MSAILSAAMVIFSKFNFHYFIMMALSADAIGTRNGRLDVRLNRKKGDRNSITRMSPSGFKGATLDRS